MNEMLNRSHLIVIPIGGLGNRLLAVFSAIRHVVEGRFNSATICWLKDIECGIDLDELFTINLPNIHIIGHRHLLPEKMTLHELVKKGENVFLEACYLFDIMGEQLCINDRHLEWYKNNIDLFIKILIKCVPLDLTSDLSTIIGVHCRRSDWGLYNDNQQIIDNHELLIDRLNSDFASYLKAINVNKFFLATDCKKTLELLKSQNDILYQDKCHYPPYHIWNGIGRDRQVMIESFVDMILLSKCARIISDSYSTFSLAASILGNIDRLIWNRTVLRSCRHDSSLYLK